jgi:predicted ATP-dependent serine protease
MPRATCKNCGRQHENTKGACPFCEGRHSIKKGHKRSSSEKEAEAESARLLEKVDRNRRNVGLPPLYK